MKHRTINKVRTNKLKKILRQRRSAGISDINSNMISIYTRENIGSNAPHNGWNSKILGTYVRQKHGNI